MILVRWETTPDDIHGMIAAQGDPHGPRRHDVARSGRRARDGQAVRRRVRGALHRHDGEEGLAQRPRPRRGRPAHDRRRHRPGDPGLRSARPAADQRGLRDDPRLGRRDAPAEGARMRTRPRTRQGPRVRRAGHRPLPHRAHVHGRGPAPVRARDDHGLGEEERRRALEKLLPHQQADFEGIFQAMAWTPGHDQAARPAAPRVPARPRRGHRRPNEGADPRVAGVEPDARDARLPPGAHVARDLRDAGEGDPARRRRGGGAHRRRAAGRDHAPAGRLRRGAEAAARDHRRDRRRGAGGRVPHRDDDRAPACMHPRRRDRRARRLLLVRDERPHADGARLLARRRGGQVPHALPRGRRPRAEPVRDARPERGGGPDARSPSSGAAASRRT